MLQRTMHATRTAAIPQRWRDREERSMVANMDSKVVQLGAYKVKRGHSSVSGLSSGAFMAVQLHLAYSSSFAGAGIVAGGPFRCAESFRGAALLAEDAYVQGALYICMNPLVPQTGP